ncbi:MAG: hypothetical protein KatS3mg027_2549 [Bacteroidia bacterium]|nr:MAG: hypothetical protein KatS3mg027_2549 [Bacteroidia bacterium]
MWQTMIKKISICLLVLVIFHTSFDATGLVGLLNDFVTANQNNIVDRIYWAKKKS